MLKDGLNHKYENLEFLQNCDFVILADHARNDLPAGVDLGVSDANMNRHIGYDIGAETVAKLVAKSLGAPLVYSLYSRLYLDCNRPPDVTAMPDISDDVVIPANQNLTAREIDERLAYHRDYHNAVDALLTHTPTAKFVISLHSFTPEMKSTGEKRPWEIGAIYCRDEDVSQNLIAILRQNTDFTVGDNQPYNEYIKTTYTIPTHMQKHNRKSTMIEIRQDRVSDQQGCEYMAEIIITALQQLQYKY